MLGINYDYFSSYVICLESVTLILTNRIVLLQVIQYCGTSLVTFIFLKREDCIVYILS